MHRIQALLDQILASYVVDNIYGYDAKVDLRNELAEAIEKFGDTRYDEGYDAGYEAGQPCC